VIVEIVLFLFLVLVLVLRLLDGWMERRHDVLHYVTKPSRARATMPADLRAQTSRRRSYLLALSGTWFIRKIFSFF